MWQVIKLLGTGGFGEVYLARWHSAEVAVKCLNPLLLSPDGAMGSVSRVGGRQGGGLRAVGPARGVRGGWGAVMAHVTT